MGATRTGRRPLALGAGVSLLAMLVGCGEAQSPAPIGEQPVARAEPSPTPPLSAPGRMPQSSETTMSAPSRPGSAPARPESIDDRVDAIEAIPFSERDPERAIEKIRPWLAHEDLDVREAAVMALSAVSGDGATEALSEHARVERDPTLKMDIVDELIDRESPASLDTLLYLLGDPDSDVRERAADGLDELGDDRAVPALHDALQGEPDEFVRDAILFALSTLDPDFDEDELDED